VKEGGGRHRAQPEPEEQVELLVHHVVGQHADDVSLFSPEASAELMREYMSTVDILLY
jgi:hypothetical protein